MTQPFSYEDCPTHAERVNWRVDQLIGPDMRLDFSRPFMPEALARTTALDFLTPDERLELNQIRGNAYLAMLGVVEGVTLAFLLDDARPQSAGEAYRTRALLQFAAEEAKRAHLFRTFSAAFAEEFGVSCKVIGPSEAIAERVLSHPPLSVAILILHFDWMSQRHFTESLQDEQELDARFRDLLLHHWMEAQQNAQTDALLVEEIAAAATPGEIDAAIEGYRRLGGFLDERLRQQAGFDLDALEATCGKAFGPAERERFMAVQHQANRWTYIGSGLSHPRFIEAIRRLKPDAVAEFRAMAELFA